MSLPVLALSATEFAELLKAVSLFAWPGVALVAVLTFRAELGNLLGRVTSGKAGPLEFQTGEALDQLQQVTDEAVRTLPPVETEYPAAADVAARKRLVADARDNPKLALIELSSEIERRSREIVASMGHADVARGGLARTLSRLDLSPPLRQAERQFRDVRNRLVHGHDTQEDEVLRALDLGFTLLDAINRIPHEAHRVVAAELDLYADDAAKSRHSFSGVLLESRHTDGEPFQRVFPTARPYREGQTVAWEWGNKSYPEYWYRDPADGTIKYGATASLEFRGTPLDEL